MNNRVSFPKMFTVNQSCIKFYNNDGLELSFAADDSCGVHKDENNHMSVAIFKGEDIVEDDHPFSGEAEEFLHLLAEHMGYELKKKE